MQSFFFFMIVLNSKHFFFFHMEAGQGVNFTFYLSVIDLPVNYFSQFFFFQISVRKL